MKSLGAPSALSWSVRELPRLPVQLEETPPTSRPRPLRSASPLARHAVTRSLAGKGRDCGPRRRREEGATTHGDGAVLGGPGCAAAV